MSYTINNYTYNNIDPTRVFELHPNSQKSFYGKALVISGNKTIYLRSYDTIVCSINEHNDLVRHWGGYSATTARHIDAFCELYGLPKLSKKEWESLPVEKVS